MKIFPALGVVFVVAVCYAATPHYTITILNPDPLAAGPRPEYQPSADLVGKSISAIFGELSEVRVEMEPINMTVIDGDVKKVEQRIRERIDHSKCLGRDSEVDWHQAPWVRGYLLLRDGRILPVSIMLSGIIVGDLLFTEEAEPDDPAKGAAPRR